MPGFSLSKYFSRLVSYTSTSSYAVEDQEIIRRFISDINNPFLVSFPRTGSHWLRLMMELYFERPSLVRVFYYPERREYLCYHTHDLELDTVRDRVIYLYRNPIDTIYSQLKYHKQDMDDREIRVKWVELYGKHLNKWLVEEDFTKEKIILSFDAMRKSLDQEFAKICDFFHVSFDKERLDRIRFQVSKDQVKEKTIHDQQVINTSPRYTAQRIDFRKKYGFEIQDTIVAQHPGIAFIFPPSQSSKP